VALRMLLPLLPRREGRVIGRARAGAGAAIVALLVAAGSTAPR
jgi:hypothetical protein